MTEQGVPGFQSGSWQGVTAPSRMPAVHLQRLQTEISRILGLPEVRNRLSELGAEAASMGSDEMTNFIRKDAARWQAVVARAGGQLDTAN